MPFIKRITLIATSAIAMAAVCVPQASAQYKLPSLHSNQHENLIANQRPAGAEIKVNNMKAFLNDLRAPPNPDSDSALYGNRSPHSYNPSDRNTHRPPHKAG